MSLSKTFGTLKSNFKLTPQKYIIDNWVFRLHYKVTALFFLVGSILVTSREFFGEHIKCIADKGVPQSVMDTFCFFTTTFTVIKHLDPDLLDSGYLAHPGIGPYGTNSSEPIKRHAYYQWVPFFLFLQGIMFCLTHLLWKKMEDKELEIEADKSTKKKKDENNYKKGAEKQDKKHVIPTKADREKKIQQIRNIFMRGMYVNENWSRNLIICEVFNFLHVILQIYITDKFLGGSFISLGSHIWSEGLEANVDILDEIFPKITKCTFHKYGPTGSIQNLDAMCVMALNIVNEKIYTGLWFWFIFLLICSILGIIWRMLTVVLYDRSKTFNRFVFSNSCPGRLNPWKTLSIPNFGRHTDWLFLVYLSKNIDPMVFRDIFQGITEDMQAKTDKKYLLDEVNSDTLPGIRG